MDLLLWIVAALSQAAVGAIGLILSVYPEIGQLYKQEVLVAVAALMTVGILSSGVSYARAAASGEVVSKLTKEILYQVKGSAHAWLDIHPYTLGKGGEEGLFHMNVYNRSGYPILDSQIGINGVCHVSMPGRESPVGFNLRLGDVYDKGGGMLSGFSFCCRKDVAYSRVDFFLSSRSMDQFMTVFVKWSGDHWLVDYVVTKEGREDGQVVVENVRPLRSDSPFSKLLS